MIRFGCCCSKDKASDALNGGFDYTELSASAIATEDNFDPASYADIKVEACNLFLPGDFKVFAGEAPFTGNFVTSDYPARLIERVVKGVGVQQLVFGSGGQRQCPESIVWPINDENSVISGCESAEAAFARILKIALGELMNHVPVAPESLNRTESNVGVSSGSFAKALAAEGIPYTADSYHILKEWDFDGLEGGLSEPSPDYWAQEIPFLPIHVHVGDLLRNAPLSPESEIRGFFFRLKELGYQGRMSFECKFEMEDAKDSMNLIRYWMGETP